MNCKEAKAILVDMARGATPDDLARETVERHVRSCPRCALHRQEQEALSRRFVDFRDALPLAPPESLESRLLEAYRGEGRAVRPGHGGLSFGFRAGLAAAAMALLVVGLVYLLTRPEQPPGAKSGHVTSIAQSKEPTDPAPANSPALRPAAEGQASGQALRPPTPNRLSVRARSPQTATASRGKPQELTSDFVAIGFPTSPIQTNTGQIVRVSLRRKALAPLGFPVAPNDEETFVQADILVGDDGSAQAIRLVSHVY